MLYSIVTEQKIKIMMHTTGTKVYGCSLPSQGTTSSSNFDHPGPPESEMPPEEVQGFLFAPRDVRVRQFEGKDNLHGIGYRGMEERGILGGKETSRALYGMRGEVRQKDKFINSWRI